MPCHHTAGKAVPFFHESVIFKPTVSVGFKQTFQIVGGNPAVYKKIGAHVQDGGKLPQESDFRGVVFQQAIFTAFRIFRGQVLRGDAKSRQHIQKQPTAPVFLQPMHENAETFRVSLRIVTEKLKPVFVYVSLRDVDLIIRR